jgi:hypothetical protein
MTMWKDPIVEEIRRIRQEHAAKFNYNIHEICEDMRRRERESGRTYVTLPPRRIEPSGPAPIPPLDSDTPLDANSTVDS